MTAPADPLSGRAPDMERLARIRASQDGVVQPDETVLFLLTIIDEQRRRADNLAVVAAEMRTLMHEMEADLDAAREELARFAARETAWRDAVQAYAEAQTLPCETSEQLDEKSRAIGRSGHTLRVLLAATGPDEPTGEGGVG